MELVVDFSLGPERRAAGDERRLETFFVAFLLLLFLPLILVIVLLFATVEVTG